AHDCSEGGLAVALAECCVVGGVGCRVDLGPLVEAGGRLDEALFGEAASRVVVEVAPGREAALEARLREARVPFLRLGRSEGEALVVEGILEATLAELATAWREGLVSDRGR
ncbi:MAG: phosphoribosylformylglycinamidine synthase II, partial [Thermomicrobiaceae bacterium]|nr:phosphoribosylformylglycinamidine synthase II [Thermomicrobiaceae bacterium]